MPKTRIKKKTNTTGGFQDLGYTLTEDELTKIGEIDNKINKVTSTDNAIARFNGTTGVIQNSTVKITDAGKIIAPSFASDATEAGMVFSDNNELNFGSNSDTLYIGYRNKLNTSGSIGIYNFGTSSGSTGMQKGRINAGDIYSNGTKVVVESALEGLATETFVTGKIAELVDSAPAELDTLKELAAGITANKTIIESVNAAIGNKAPNNHASTATTYGVATTSAYGHVKINNGDVNTVASSNGVAAGMDHSHSNYVQTSRKINGNTLDDDITLTASDVGAEPAFTKNTAFNKNFGTAAGTVCQGNDSRLSNARTPTAHTHVKADITDFPTIPTKTSDLTNDSGFITSDDLSSSVTSVVGQTGDVTADQIKTGIQTTEQGFAIGRNASATWGGAIGANTSATQGFAGGAEAKETAGGGAVGQHSSTTTGGAVGSYASAANGGGAVGESADANYGGGAIGYDAEASDGFAGGYKAKATAMGAVQLGEGTNSTNSTLQFKSYQLLNTKGIIPFDRNVITQSNYYNFQRNSNYTILFDGETTPAASGHITIQGGKALRNYRMIFVLGSGDSGWGAEWNILYGWQLDKMYSMGTSKIVSVKLASADSTGVWNISPASLASTTTLTLTGENMKIYMIIGVD